nr:hypothetical protein [uncultured Dyadobacter sp.]
MKQPVSKSSYNIWFTLDAQQYNQLQSLRQKTTCRSLAEYIRKLICQEPITINHRDASLEGLVTELSLLRRHLATASEALALSADRIAKASNQPQLDSWLDRHQRDRQLIAGQIQQIYLCSKKAALRWLQ